MPFAVGEVRVAEDTDFNYFRSLCNDEEGWKLEYSKSNLTIFLMPTENTNIRIIKIRTNLTDVSAQALYDALHDASYRKVWDKGMIEGFEICSVNPSNEIGYYAMRSLPPFKNRDFVTQRSWMEGDNEYIIFNHSVCHAKMPPKKNFVRAISYITGYLIIPTGPKSCHLTYLGQGDPRGYLPAWVVNKATQFIAPRMMQRLTKAARAYPEWKRSHNPGYQPWRYPEQITAAKIDWNDVRPPSDLNAEPIIDESQATEIDDKVAEQYTNGCADSNGSAQAAAARR